MEKSREELQSQADAADIGPFTREELQSLRDKAWATVTPRPFLDPPDWFWTKAHVEFAVAADHLDAAIARAAHDKALARWGASSIEELTGPAASQDSGKPPGSLDSPFENGEHDQ